MRASVNISAAAESLVPPTLAALAAAPQVPRRWFFEDLLPAGAFLIVGRPKIGKSFLLLQLALATAQGESFLGYPALGPTGVLYIAAEDDYTRVVSRALQLQSDLPSNLSVLVREDFATWAAARRDKDLPAFVDEWLGQHPEVTLILIDTEETCRTMWDGDSRRRHADAKARDYAATRAFDAVALRHRCFIGLVNHSSKRRNGQYFDIHELINRTNVALAGASGSIVLADPPDHDPMDETSKLRVLGFRGRDLANDVQLAVIQETNGSFRNLGRYIGYHNTQTERTILDALETITKSEPDAWVTADELGDALGRKPATVRRAISRMIKAGRTEYPTYRIETKPSQGIRRVSRVEPSKL